MINTRFMQVMFSATEEKDVELLSQVAGDIDTAKKEGSFDDGEVSYVDLGSGKVLVTDKENGEATIITQDPETPESFDMDGFENTQALEQYLHTMEDGVTPNPGVATEPTEDFEDHMTGEDVISPNLEDGGLNPQAGFEPTVEDHAECGEEGCNEDEEEEKVYSDNNAVLKIFSNPELHLSLFSEVVTDEKPAIVGDLKFEVDEECPDTVIVTDLETGDAATIECDEEGKVIVNETQHENSEEEQYEPLVVVGVNTTDSDLVSAEVYDEEEAHELAQRLTEDGIEGVQVFEDPDEARDYAFELLGECGVSDIEAVAEPEEHNFSDVTIYTQRFFSDAEIYEATVTSFMERMFSEEEDEITDSQDIIEDAIESGEQVEDDDLVVTPISDSEAIVADKKNDEYTKATLEEGEISVEKISEEEADELTEDLHTSEEEEKAYSDYEVNLSIFSDVQDEVANAIENGEVVDTDEKEITPVSDNSAVVYDKDADEYTKVELLDSGDLKTEVISEDEADKVIEEHEEEEAEAEEAAKKFSTLGKFFSEMEEGQVDPQTGDPIVAQDSIDPAMAEAPAESVEGIEDKALAAVQSIQEAANNAVLAIQEAKEAPAPGEEEDLREAQFSDFNDNTVVVDHTLHSFLTNI